jgi:hypothetical protein
MKQWSRTDLCWRGRKFREVEDVWNIAMMHSSEYSGQQVFGQNEELTPSDPERACAGSHTEGKEGKEGGIKNRK